MGTILHEGEYILLSNKIINETRYMGYAILSHIGVNTSKVDYLGLTRSTKHFSTYAVAKDLELPFSTSEWQDFEVRGVRFHAYNKGFKNLILMGHDEFSMDYIDEINDFFEKKKKENKKMTIKVNNYIYIASNTTGFSDDQLIAALIGYVPTCTESEMIHQCAPLWSRTKFLKERDFDVIDARRRLQEIDEKLNFATTYKGDIIIYRNISFNDTQSIIDAYDEYSKRDDMEKFNCVKSNSGRYDAARLNTADGGHFSFNCQPILTMPRNLGRSVAISMLNSHYGLYGGGLRYKKPSFNFELRFGIEHATGRYKTICLWEDGEKTIICGDNKATKLPVAQAFAWCYVKRTFRSVSQFKKHVDKRTTKMDGVWYFEGDCLIDEYAQGSVSGSSKKRDIYDAAALAIVSKRYGGLRKLVDEYINKEDKNGTK